MDDPRHERDRELVGRLRSHLALKLGLAIGLVTIVSGIFFSVAHNPLRPVWVLEPSAVDRRIGFDQRWVWVYLSSYFFMPLTPLLLCTRHELRRYALGMLGITAAACLVFVLFPTAVARPQVSDPSFLYSWLTRLDPGTNAVPSLHWAFVLFTLLTAERVLGELSRSVGFRAAYWSWAVLICVSTLGVKQHLVLDAVTGIALGLLGHALTWRTFTLRKRVPVGTDAPGTSLAPSRFESP